MQMYVNFFRNSGNIVLIRIAHIAVFVPGRHTVRGAVTSDGLWE